MKQSINHVWGKARRVFGGMGLEKKRELVEIKPKRRAPDVGGGVEPRGLVMTPHLPERGVKRHVRARLDKQRHPVRQVGALRVVQILGGESGIERNVPEQLPDPGLEDVTRAWYRIQIQAQSAWETNQRGHYPGTPPQSQHTAHSHSTQSQHTVKTHTVTTHTFTTYTVTACEGHYPGTP